jgi:molecular chaperone GrpE (heat shock protein)
VSAPEEPAPDVARQVVPGEEILARLDRLQSLFERRILDDRDKRQQLAELRDGPFRQYLHPLVHRLALLIDRLDQHLDLLDPQDREAVLAAAVRDELLDTLAAHGVREIDTEDGFDPARHEAAELVHDEHRPAGTVDRVLRRGLCHDSWVFRTARVAVVTHRRKGPAPGPAPGAIPGA